MNTLGGKEKINPVLEVPLDINEEVMKALEERKPVVALESTIISHGMPYPQNIEMAKRVETIVKENGAIPATIAIINGRIKIGISEAQLDFLATSEKVEKASRRDIPVILARKKNAAQPLPVL